MVSLALSLELSKLSQCFLPNCFDCVCRNLMQIGDALDKATMPGQTHLLQPQKLWDWVFFGYSILTRSWRVWRCIVSSWWEWIWCSLTKSKPQRVSWCILTKSKRVKLYILTKPNVTSDSARSTQSIDKLVLDDPIMNVVVPNTDISYPKFSLTDERGPGSQSLHNGRLLSLVSCSRWICWKIWRRRIFSQTRSWKNSWNLFRSHQSLSVGAGLEVAGWFDRVLASWERLELPLSLPPRSRMATELGLGFWLLSPMLEPCFSSSSSVNAGCEKLYLHLGQRAW